MQVQTCTYRIGAGWDNQPDASLDSGNSLVIVFGSPDLDQVRPVIDELINSFPQSMRIGCSTAGQMYGDSLLEGGLVVSVILFEHSTIRLAVADQAIIQQSADSGISLASELKSDDLQAVFLLSEGLHVNGSGLLDGMRSVLGDNVVVTGGLAGDNDRFSRTWVLAANEIAADKVVAVGFYGDFIDYRHGSRGGWDVMGPEREVTRSAGNVLYELDGRPALELYKQYLGERAEDLPASGLLFPLAIRNEAEEDGLTVRTILAIDEQQQSITFAGDLPQGSLVQMMYANFDRLVDGANDAATNMTYGVESDGPQLCIGISCVGRKLILGQRTEEEIEAVVEQLPGNAGLIGYYSYGEISPLASGRCDLHNQTMTLTMIGEKRAD